MPRTHRGAVISTRTWVYNLVEGMHENMEDLTSIVRVMADTSLEVMATDTACRCILARCASNEEKTA